MKNSHNAHEDPPIGNLQLPVFREDPMTKAPRGPWWEVLLSPFKIGNVAFQKEPFYEMNLGMFLSISVLGMLVSLSTGIGYSMCN